jgi:hypothetical protein
VPNSGNIAPLSVSGLAQEQQTTNWAGYDATGGPFTGVRGTFTVPGVGAGATSSEYTTVWVGLDGADNDNLMNAGIIEEVDPSNASAFLVSAFWVIGVGSSLNMIDSVDVSAGDTVSVIISQVSGTTWEISLQDVTNGESYSTTQTYTGPGSEADWIVSSGSVEPFTPAVSFSNLGVAGTATGLEEPVLYVGNSAAATPSALSGTNFSVSYTGS